MRRRQQTDLLVVADRLRVEIETPGEFSDLHHHLQLLGSPSGFGRLT
jgi:hypothetical protein